MSEQTYRPMIRLGGNPNPNVDQVQDQVDALGVTHACSISGDVQQIHRKLNRRSVRLDSAGLGPQRWEWDRVSSLGVMADGTDGDAGASDAGRGGARVVKATPMRGGF